MELAGVLGVGAVAVLVCHQATDDDLNLGLPFGGLCKVAIVAGDNDYGLFRSSGMTKPQSGDGILA
jgi:hypothetical protein